MWTLNWIILWFLFFAMITQFEMGKRSRKKRNRSKNKFKNKQQQLQMKFNQVKKGPKASQELNLTGRFRVVKTIKGTILLVQNINNGQFDEPTQEQVDYLVEKRLISQDIGNVVPIGEKGTPVATT